MAISRISMSLCRFVRSMRGSSISAKCSTSLYLGRSFIAFVFYALFLIFPYPSLYNVLVSVSFLDAFALVETVLNFAKTLTFRGQNPVVKLIEKVYETGVKLSKAGMEKVEARINRLPSLKKWFVEIFAKPL
jgi:hypothetical protein